MSKSDCAALLLKRIFKLFYKLQTVPSNLLNKIELLFIYYRSSPVTIQQKYSNKNRTKMLPYKTFS